MTPEDWKRIAALLQAEKDKIDTYYVTNSARWSLLDNLKNVAEGMAVTSTPNK